MGLKEAAAVAAGSTTVVDPLGPFASEVPGAIDMGEYEPGDDEPEMVPVHIAWSRVRRDVRSIGKNELYNQSGTRFNYRGVDTMINAFAPITLKHGINIFPVDATASYRDILTSKGNKMRECTVRMVWEIVGPMGDRQVTCTQGEALDTSDKGTAKAQSVALRVLLERAGLVPTSDADPDSEHVQRGEAGIRTPESYREELLLPETTFARTERIGAELFAAGLLKALVSDRDGKTLVTLDVLGTRLLEERRPPEQGQAEAVAALYAAGAERGMDRPAVDAWFYAETRTGPGQAGTALLRTAAAKVLEREPVP
ncbi:ERF family protein [Streptacidiphilus sp. N1-12]|uniref:ERF family protein n=2 Tax=Streptacidiphilus alkalitolerans TaxID=3342712 RepID=A0ABV6WE95_9ACTN